MRMRLPRRRRRAPMSSRRCARSRPVPSAPTAIRPKGVCMREAFICDAVRTPIGRYGGALAKVRTDDLAAVPPKALIKRNSKVDWAQVDGGYFGRRNPAAEEY